MGEEKKKSYVLRAGLDHRQWVWTKEVISQRGKGRVGRTIEKNGKTG